MALPLEMASIENDLIVHKDFKDKYQAAADEASRKPTVI
jgi:hypothetical protein